MNFVYLVCNTCEGVSEKDTPLIFKKKNSKNSIINQNIEIPKDEIISNDSTSNLEIIDYPYANFGENYSSQLLGNDLNFKRPSNDFYLNHIKNIQKLPINKLESNNLNASSIRNSLGESSLIVNNEDNIIQNKALLSNYYKNYEKLQKKNIIKNYIPKNNNNKIKTKKKNCKKLIIDIDMGKKYTETLLKKNNSSINQIFKLNKKNKDIKTNKTDVIKHKTIKKCKTNFNIEVPKKIKNTNSNNKKTEIINNNKIILNNKSLILKNKKIDSNNKNEIITNKSFVINNKNIKVDHKKLILNHKNGVLNNNSNNKNYDKQKYLKRKYISYCEINSKNIISQEKVPVNKLKKIYKGANTLNHKKIKHKSINKIGKKYSFLPKMKFSNSSNKINNSLINKIYINDYRNSTTNNIENRRNNMNFSYLWLTNRDTNYISKSYLNPFDKFVNRTIFQKKIIK